MFPLVTDELISRLDSCFPQKPDRSMSHREMDVQVGQQMVIDIIKGWRAEGLAAEHQLNPLSPESPWPSGSTASGGAA